MTRVDICAFMVAFAATGSIGFAAAQSGIGPNVAGLPALSDAESFAITAENPTGEKGKGGQAASDLGPTRKGRPSIALPPGKTVLLADLRGAGCIKHIWCTIPPPGRDYHPGPN